VVVVADPVGVLDRHLGKQICLILRKVEHQVQSETAGRSNTEILKTKKKLSNKLSRPMGRTA
jgi:hypothetical protein